MIVEVVIKLEVKFGDYKDFLVEVDVLKEVLDEEVDVKVECECNNFVELIVKDGEVV